MNRAAAAIFLVIVCSGCPHRIDFGPTGPITDAEELLQRTRAAQEQVATLVGDGNLRVESPQGQGSVSAYVGLARPGRLHLEMFDFFNRPVALLVTDGAQFGLYQVQEGRYYRGPASSENLSRLLPVALPPEELVPVMLGQVPFIPAERMALRLDMGEGVYVLTLQKGEVTQELHIHPTWLRVVRSRVLGLPAYDLAYDDFQQRGGLVFPLEVELTAASAKTRLRMRYTDISVNEAPDPSLFEPIPPEGVPVVEVDAQGREVPRLELPPSSPGS